MTSTDITRAEAQRRSALLATHAYRIELDLTEVGHAPTFGSRTVLEFDSAEPGTSTWVDLIADEVRSATLNGEPLDVSGYDGARLHVGPLAEHNVLEVHARCWYMTSGEGLHRSVDPADGAVYLYTQFATAEARRVFACFEQPDLKATVTWVVTGPEGWQVASNSATPVAEPAGSGLSRWSFAPTPRISTYLAALSAGPFHVVADEYRGPHGAYPLRLLVRASMAPYLDAEEILTITRAGLAHYERLYVVPYPFGTYDQVFVPEFNLGAMENPGMVTFREDRFIFRSRVTAAARDERAMVILHEMAHMWFGDLVTMRWWDDLWLNESFAEWSGFHAAAAAAGAHEAWTSFALGRKGWAYAQDQLHSTHPVVADMVDLEAVYLNFDGITYAKGASVLKQLVAHVGFDAFVAGLNRYFQEHAWGTATLADLLVELEATSGRDLSGWARQWLQTPGVTTLVPHVELDPHGRYARVRISQLPAARPAGIEPVLRPHRVAVGLYRWTDPTSAAAGARAGARLERVERIEVDLMGDGVEVPELVGLPAADLLLVNDDDLTYAKIRFDAASLATVRAGLGAIAPSLPRALVWAGLWEMVLDGELPAQDYADIALAALADEDVPAIIETVRRALHRAMTELVAPELRPDLAHRACAATAELLHACDPGSDGQLALMGLHVECASRPDRLQWLQRLLDGHESLPGLDLDADLRWQVVHRLAATGTAPDDLIDATLAADPSTRGRQSAARARAARPDPAAKESAWQAAVDAGAGRLPNALLAATLHGFAEPGAPVDLLAPFAGRYGAEIVGIWAARPPVEAQVLARGLFPRTSPEALRVADTLLASADLPSGLRRVVVENRDEVERARALQEVSRAAAQATG